MPTKKNNYIEEELSWIEDRVAQIKSYIDANPYDKMTERLVWITGPRGDSQKVAATIEQQQTASRAAMKDYVLLLEALDKLRQREESKQEVKGGGEVPHRMQPK